MFYNVVLVSALQQSESAMPGHISLTSFISLFRSPENRVEFSMLYSDHNKLWKILKEMGIPDPLTCLLSNLYSGQEATVRTGHGTTD